MSQPLKFTKRPVTIEAAHFDGSLASALDILDWIGDAADAELDDDGNLTIHTLEGDMTADWGDWVIRGVQGEFYPCKPDIFHQTYTEAPREDAPTHDPGAYKPRLPDALTK